MSRTVFVVSMVVLAGAALVVSSGCSTSQPGIAAAGNASASGSADPGPADPVGEQPDQVSAAEIEKALASLSTEDRALAAKQRVCPVTEEPLGSMGTPVKVHVRGRDVFLCCKGCEGELRAQAEADPAQGAK